MGERGRWPFRRGGTVDEVQQAFSEAELERKRKELAFLENEGAIEGLIARAAELKGRFGDVKLGVAIPSTDKPMDIVLSWGEHSPDFKGRRYLRAWNTVVVGTKEVGEDRRLTINGRILEANTVHFKALLRQAVSRPISREFDDVPMGANMENKNLFASERQMSGRKKIKIKKPRGH